MQHLDFLLWFLLFPISVSICNYLEALKYKLSESRKVYSKEVEGYTGLAIIVIWFFVGYQLF
jgi:hypothetical protein